MSFSSPTPRAFTIKICERFPSSDFNIFIFFSPSLDTKRRKSRNVKSTQFMYEIMKPPIDDNIIEKEDSEMKCCWETQMSQYSTFFYH